MAKSCLPHLTVLQQHGLSAALLERFATFCQTGKQGSFIFHTGPEGMILAYEEHHKAPVHVLEERSLDNFRQHKR